MNNTNNFQEKLSNSLDQLSKKSINGEPYSLGLIENDDTKDAYNFIDHVPEGFYSMTKITVGKVLKDPQIMNDEDIKTFIKTKEYYTSKKDPEKNIWAEEYMPNILPAIEFLDIAEKGIKEIFPEIYKKMSQRSLPETNNQ